MTALSDTLAAAQGRALAALERAYLRDLLDAESFASSCDAIGARDVLERADLLACLDVLREYGATEPPSASNGQPPKMISERQRDYIKSLADDRGVVSPDTAGLTAAKASELITALQRGTYNPDDWDLPF
jgi:hypothetical protein